MKNFSEVRSKWLINKILELEKKGITQVEIAKKMGIKPQYLTPMLSGKRNVSENFAQKFINLFEINQNDLLKQMNDYNLKNAKTMQEIPLGFPLYDVSASAGYGSFDEMIKSEKLVGNFIIPGFTNIDWMIYVAGASMYPKYSSGDIIACRVLHESRFIQWGKVYVIATSEQGILVKRLKKCENEDYLTAVCDNPAYDSFDIPKNEILGIALVVGVVRLE
jgi:phage repressor protein C with HTH and peptisase S24 domain